jgi:hypothetical protein
MHCLAKEFSTSMKGNNNFPPFHILYKPTKQNYAVFDYANRFGINLIGEGNANWWEFDLVAK